MQGDILEKAMILQSVRVNDVRTTRHVYNDRFFSSKDLKLDLLVFIIFTVV